MTLGQKLDRLFNKLEWRWSLLVQMVTAVSSFALPAWAVKTTTIFIEYSPFSWVAAGFGGLIASAIVYALYGYARSKIVKAKYDNNLYQRTGFVDPMAKTFENKRIFIADFVLPSDPFITDKTFINCEIIGPANLFLRGHYQVNEQQLPICDAVALNGDRRFFNGVTVENCTFRKCSFKRITLMMLPHEYQQYRNLEWLNWVSAQQADQLNLPGVAEVLQTEGAKGG